MTLQEVEEIRACFHSKAPKEYYMNAANIECNGVKYGGAHLFDGLFDNSKKLASLQVKAIDSENMSVTLFIGWNMYEFIELPNLCVELINRFVPVIQPELSSGDHTFRKQVV